MELKNRNLRVDMEGDDVRALQPDVCFKAFLEDREITNWRDGKKTLQENGLPYLART